MVPKKGGRAKTQEIKPEPALAAGDQAAAATLRETPEIPQKPQETKKDEETNGMVKELEQAFFTLKFYPVAVKESGKDEAIEKLRSAYRNGNETIRQLILYMVHEALAQSAELKTMYNFDFFRRKNPNAEPGQIRINVYRAMFNYNFSLEGMIELIKLLATLPEDDAAKVLSYHFSFLSAIEVEGAHMLRNAIIDALGETESEYALRCLLQYAKYTDNERMLQRLAASLAKWDQKIDGLTLSRKEKDKLKASLEQVLTLEFGDSHYG